MIKFKAWNARPLIDILSSRHWHFPVLRNSRAIAKFHNMGIGHFEHSAFIHELIRGSLVKPASRTFHQSADVVYLLFKVDNRLTAILLFCLNFLFEKR
jgi:hypothetical protein